MSPQLFSFFSDAHLRFQKYNQHSSPTIGYSFQLDITQVHDLSARRKLLERSSAPSTPSKHCMEPFWNDSTTAWSDKLWPCPKTALKELKLGARECPESLDKLGSHSWFTVNVQHPHVLFRRHRCGLAMSVDALSSNSRA
jgi:hypothetical protein